MTQTVTEPKFNYRATAEAILGSLRNERDRKIVAQRFSLGLNKRQTLEKIGSDFGITRERVRQIEKSATNKLKQNPSPQLRQIDTILTRQLQAHNHVHLLQEVASKVGATTPAERAYITFLASLAPSIEVIEDSEHFHPALAKLPDYDKRRIALLTEQLVGHLEKHGKPLEVDSLHSNVAPEIPRPTLENIARISKKLANLEGQWGLHHWPEVNPRSIRDKTYLVLNKEKNPLHFSDIAERIGGLGQKKRDVTVQAVHNELIKDPRFVLVGRGIYALAEWGYTPGTVADIITEILQKEAPLHKDEIVKRVLEKRQVKTTTIVLNLQEKDQFVRVSKATYSLK